MYALQQVKGAFCAMHKISCTATKRLKIQQLKQRATAAA
jgi:hypothetical protein